MGNLAGSSAKFIYQWIRKELITGVVMSTTNKLIDDICAFEE